MPSGQVATETSERGAAKKTLALPPATVGDGQVAAGSVFWPLRCWRWRREKVGAREVERMRAEELGFGEKGQSATISADM